MDSIAVSIDGPPEVHDRIRGQKGAFEKATPACARWRTGAGSWGRVLPMQIAILPVTELNLETIAAAVEALGSFRSTRSTWGCAGSSRRRSGREYERVMRETFGDRGDVVEGVRFRRVGSPGVAREADGGPRPAVEGVEAPPVPRFRARAPWISFVPDVPPERVPEYFSDFSQTFGHDLCPVAWYFAQVEPDGEVCFCGDFPDYFIGNVRKQTFREVWTGDKAWKFRAETRQEPLPICARCCGNYVYGKWQRPENKSYSIPAPAEPLSRVATK